MWVLKVEDRNAPKRSNGDSLTRLRSEIRESVVEAQTSQAHEAASTPGAGFQILSAYLLGPLSPAALRDGRWNRLWAAVAPLSVLYWFLLVRWRNELAASGGLPLVLGCLLVGVLFAGLAPTGWSRAILRLKTAGGSAGDRSSFLKKPAALLVMGLLVPGLGLVLSGRTLRAAVAFWFCVLGLISGAALRLAGTFWTWSLPHSAADSRRLLELLLLSAAVLCLTGIVAWVAQTLDGVRLGSAVESRRVRSDWFSLALLGAILLFLGIFRSAPLAEELDRLGVERHAREYRVLPALAAVAAMKLDPSRPGYALAAAGYLEDLGRNETATRIREDLARRWTSYADWRRTPSLETDPAPGRNTPPVPSTWGRISGFYADPLPPDPASERP